jgi:hypothetical protein
MSPGAGLFCGFYIQRAREPVGLLRNIRMAGEKLFTAALDVTTGALSQDIGKVVAALVKLGLTVKTCKKKCGQLVDHVESLADSVDRVERERASKGWSAAFNEAEYKVTLRKFLAVVEDCKACVQRYQSKGSLVRAWLSLNFEEDFDSLHKRLRNAVKGFDFEQQVHQTVLLHHTSEGVEEMKGQLYAVFEEMKALREDRMAPDDTQLLNVDVGESLVEGYILAGRLDDGSDVMLVATENKKKEASMLKRLSDSDNILRFYGTFADYLVMGRPGQTLQTVYDWNREDHGGEWRLKRMMALEIALGLAYAHIAGTILHRNLRSANVFLTDDGHAKIFGFFKGRVKSKPSDKKWTDAEQLRWAAPEMLDKNRPEYNEACDIFSLGVIIWELITGGSPFSEFPGIMQLVTGRLKDKKRLDFKGFESDVPFLVAFQQVSLDCMKDAREQRPTVDNVVSRLELLAPEDMICASLGTVAPFAIE